MNVFKMLGPDGQVQDEHIKQLLAKQAQGFQKFTQALSTAKIDANAVIAQGKKP
jgi:hypothetical protein